MRTVLLRKRFGSCFAGEKAGYPDALAERLIASGDAYALDKAGNPIVQDARDLGKDLSSTEPAKEFTRQDNPDKGNTNKGNTNQPNKGEPDGGTSGESNNQAKDDSDQVRFHPFVMDGLDNRLINALARAEIGNPDQLREYIAAGKSLAEIKGVSQTSADHLMAMYGPE